MTEYTGKAIHVFEDTNSKLSMTIHKVMTHYDREYRRMAILVHDVFYRTSETPVRSFRTYCRSVGQGRSSWSAKGT